MYRELNERIIVWCIFCLAGVTSATPAAYAMVKNGRGLYLNTNAHASFVPGEILVKFKPATSSQVRRKTIGSRGHQKIRDLGSRGLTHIKIAANQKVEAAIAAYKNDPAVEYVQPNYIRHMTTAPNDPLYAQEWGLKNTGQTVTQSSYPDLIDTTNNPGTAGQDMSMESAWSLSTDCSSVLIAVVDTGVNYNHGDLAGNMWNGNPSYPNHGANFVTTAGDVNLTANDPMDYTGHGTHVAGTIGAIGNNGVGTSGVCWTARIMAVRVLDSTGSGTTADIYAGIEFAVQQGAKVMNMSFGGNTDDPTEESAIKDALAAGAIVVAAAGNDGTNNDTSGNPFYPCGYTEANVICVAALDQKFNLASFSNFGVTSVDVAAPGTNILSTWPGTVTTISDAFNTAGAINWTHSTTTSGGWAYGQRTFSTGTGSLTLDMLFDPSNWDGANNVYNSNTNDHVYKSFAVAASSAVTVNFSGFVDLGNNDAFNIYFKAGTTDPIPGGTNIGNYTGSGGDQSQNFTSDIHACSGLTCSVGFQLLSGATAPQTGLGIFDFSISELANNTTSFNIIEGTSMATPHVTGLAALVWAYNSNYTYADVINNIVNSGNSLAALSGKIVSGKAVNGYSALTYINAPSGVKAVKQ